MGKPRQTVLFFGYYDDFAHFFAKVTQQLLAETPYVHPIFVTGFISGWLAWGRHARGRDRAYITTRVFVLTQWYRLRYWQRIPPSAFRGYAPKSLLRYEFQSTGRYGGVHALLALIQVFDELFRTHAPAYLVVSGDSRVSARVCIAAARKYGCKIGYFEQGPFGTSFLDPNGVNADLTVPVPPADVPQMTALPAICSRDAKPEVRSALFRASDYALSYLPFWPSEFQSRFISKRLQPKKTNVPHTHVAAREREFLFVLQVPNDANFIIHSDFSDFESALRLAAAALPEDAVLAVREHPKFRGAYGTAVYNVIARSPQMYLQEDMNGLQALNRCVGVITVNSMMGLEAVLAARPVFLLGRSYYKTLCQVPNQPDDSFSALQEFLSAPADVNLAKVAWFWAAFLQDTAILGHFRDTGMKAAIGFAHKIRAQL